MTDRFDVVIIGAGHNGLVCAGYLAQAGLKVVCVDSGDTAGGMSGPRVLGNDYQVPGLAHAGYPISPRVRRDLELDRFGYAPGASIDTVSIGFDRVPLVIKARGLAGRDVPGDDMSRYPRFRHEFRQFTRALQPLFENQPPRLKDMSWRDRSTLAKLGWNIRAGLGRDSMYEFLRVSAMNIHDVLDETFDDERLKGALAAEAILGSAMGPRTPGSVLTWLQRLHGELHGPLSVHCGVRSGLVGALTRSAEATGVSIRLQTRVERILADNGRATGVELSNGEKVTAGIVVSNADPRTTFLNLLGAARLDAMFANRVGQIRGTGTVAKLHLALSDLPEFSGLEEAQLRNRLLVAPSMRFVERAFNHSKYGEFSADPVLEITIPSLHDDALAPAGHHVMSVNVAFAPYNLKGGWDAHQSAVSDSVIARLERYAPGMRALIVDQEFLTPRDIEMQYGALEGHWHHGELAMHQSFMMRPVYGASQYDSPIQNLFLCGAGCHPGGGLTGMPGRNAAKRVLELGEAA